MICIITTQTHQLRLLNNVVNLSSNTSGHIPQYMEIKMAIQRMTCAISLTALTNCKTTIKRDILWYKEGKLVEYSSVRASVTVKSDDSDKGIFQSHLIIDNVTLSDAGLYKCDSDLTGEESVQV